MSKAGNARAWLDLMADDVCFRSIAGGEHGMEFTRESRSRADVARYFEEMLTQRELVHFTADDFIAQGDRVAVRGRCAWRSRKTGVVAESPMARGPRAGRFRGARVAVRSTHGRRRA